MLNRRTDQRRKAEALASMQVAQAKHQPRRVDNLSPEETLAVLHELRVHQIELELQNEELRLAQVNLESTQARYFDLYDLAPVGYCTLSRQGLIMQSNLTAAALLGAVRKDLIVQPLSRFILSADRGQYFKHHKDLIVSGESQSCELRLSKKDGSTVWVHLVATLALDDQGAAEYRVMLVDVSLRKHMEAEVLAHNAQLDEARVIADKANQAKSEFLSSMSHELRTPLNSILGFAQLLEAGKPALTEGQQARTGQILKSGWYLLELVNEILDLSVIEAGRMPVAMAPVNLAAALLECHSMIDPQAHGSDIRLRYPAFDRPLWVHADLRHLKQILINLLSNAIKYNRAGGSIEVTYSERPCSRVRISVRDTGDGLSDEKLTQLFQPFNRLGQEAGAIKGAGIGLVVSKRLVEMMGGSIGAESTLGTGSVFWIELSCAEAPPNHALSGTTRAAQRHRARGDDATRTLLYVEDNLANQELIQDLMSGHAGIRLLTAADCTSGIALARTEKPDLILMDINLPGMSGLDALRILRQDPSTQHILVIALSANAMPCDIQDGLEAGFFRYITKPIQIDAFMLLLDQTLEFLKTRQ